jgi:hypothetical protein
MIETITGLQNVNALTFSYPNAQSVPKVLQDAHRSGALYNKHHFTCPTCCAAGRGAMYGNRCNLGAFLWQTYQESAITTQVTDRASLLARSGAGAVSELPPHGNYGGIISGVNERG